MAKAGRALLILLCTVVSSFVAMGLLFGIKAGLNYDLYSLILRFIVPVGALGAGIVAGIGLVIGTMLIGYRTPPRLVWLFPLIAIAAHLFYLYLDYWTMRLDNVPLRTLISFLDYIKLYAQSWKIGYEGKPSTLLAGSILQCLQIAGFSLPLMGTVFCYNAIRFLQTL